MKHLTLIIFSLLLVGSAISQTIYESPHVKDGKTITFTLPVGYHLAANSVYYGNAVYSTDPTMDVEAVEFETLEHGILAVSHETYEEGGLEDFVEEMKTEVAEMSGVTVIDAPHVEVLNGRKCLMAAISGVIEGESRMDAMYVSATVFGDYMVVIYYMVAQKKPENLTYANFKKVCGSAKEIATDREDEMMSFDEEWEYDGEMEEEYVTNFVNDLYETDITYYDILPDFGDYWDETMEENSHLLAEFIYKEDLGNIAVFSGGDAGNYPSKTEMAKAIQAVFELSAPPILKVESTFSNEDHDFTVYSISGAGPIASLYATTVSDELVFFVAVNADPVSAEFKAAARDFMMSMWVDSDIWGGAGDGGDLEEE